MRKILGLLFASTLLACTAAPPPTGELDSPVLAKSTGFRWTNPIDYEWDSSVTSSMQSDIVTGLQQYTDLTTLTFHHGIEPGRPHIQYTVQNPYGGNGSYTDPVDPTTGTTIHFAPSISARSVVHETGHALGLSHEQKRPDAANTVSYDINCAVEPTQFATLTGSDVETFGPYDIDSVMEYSSEQGCVKTASGTGGVNNTGCVCFPLVTKGHSHTSMSGYIPLSPQLSIEDINGLWHMYGPKLGKSEEGDKLGAAFAVGDFDHDGYDDLAVGAPG
ncbi:MAG TPA: M12 family metallopeptidase, partial [Polyangia bacterium]